MKINSTHKLGRKALLSAAVSAAVCTISVNAAETSDPKLRAVSAFAADSTSAMAQESSKLYLQNQHLSASSTFPMLLMAAKERHPWYSSPFMPIQARDLSCYYGVPSYQEPQQFDPDTTPIKINAGEAEGDLKSGAAYRGGVEITQGDREVRTQEARYDKQKQTINTQGSTVYQSGLYTLSTNQPAKTNLETKQSSLRNANFMLNGSPARGSAGSIEIDHEKQAAVIKDAVFSTCPAGSNAWHIQASKVELEQDQIFGTAHNSMLYLGKVPVFYFPYAKFPVSNQRQSGLLYPSASISSDSGFDFAQPIYWNIAPNYDYTFTPRVMTRRGVLLGNEFRYLPIAGSEGQIAFDYMPRDNNWQMDESDSQRWMLRLKHHSGFLNDDLSLDLDYQQVRSGDYDYLSDLGPDGATVTDDHLQQSLKASYYDDSYTLGLELRRYQTLLPETAINTYPFEMLPQLSAYWHQAYDQLLLESNAEYTRFSSPNEGNYHSFNADRLHLEPAATLQLLNWRGTSLTAGARGFLTHYQQDDAADLPDYYTHDLKFTKLDHETDRALYLLQVRGKTTFERKILDMRHTQTLEPEIQYQYIPYKNQDHIGLYDTTDRISDYYSNYSFRHFTGLDRIADLNTFTFGLTSRILDPHDRELYRFSISQAYSLVPTRVTLNPGDSRSKYPRSPLSVSVNANPLDGLTARAALSYSNETNAIDSADLMAEYLHESGFAGQVSYRFIREGNRSLEDQVVDLSQLGVSAEIPLGRNFKFIGAAYRDLEQKRSIDTKLALRYEECCYAVTLMYEEYSKTNWHNMTADHDNIIGIQLELKGLGAINASGSRDPDSMDTKLLPSFNPTNLNR